MEKVELNHESTVQHPGGLQSAHTSYLRSSSPQKQAFEPILDLITKVKYLIKISSPVAQRQTH